MASTVIFSLAFVGQRYAMVNYSIGVWTFTATRYIFSVLFLQLIHSCLSPYSNIDFENEAAQKSGEAYTTRNGGNRSIYFWTIMAGASNFGGSILQQYSLAYIDVATSAFITGSYVVLIPFIEWLLPACFGWPKNPRALGINADPCGLIRV